MPRIIIADTSCLILLQKIGELDILKKVFGKVFVTSTVSSEFGKDLPEWIERKEPRNSLQQPLDVFLDAGEASAIALALEEDSPLLVIDELKGRKIARELKIDYTGTLGVIGAAKTKGEIASVKPIIDKIRNTNFRVSEILLKKILALDQQ